MDTERQKQILDVWKRRFGDARGILWSRAPGRVNLIGEHTDYNQGYVFPIAIDRDIVVAFRPNGTGMVNLHALNLHDDASFALVDPKADPAHPWMVYPMGIARILGEKGVAVPGLNVVFHGTVPTGGGLSSSAALTVAFGLAYSHAAGAPVDRRELALMCQQTEHRFCGVRCGIMDQFVSLHAQRGKAVFLDCRDLRHELVPCEFPDARFIICDTRVKHELASTEYNIRREQCEEAAAVLAEFLPGVKSLRDVNIQQFKAYQHRVPSPMRERARHVITENHRVLAARQAMLEGDALRLGILMDASHDSLDADYQVTSDELNLLVSLARDCKGVFGSRMTGGGFGGCTVTLVAAGRVEEFCERVSRGYRERTGIEPHVYVVQPEQGAEILAP
ncbi:MAG TPA: galactokinase [Planctomycetota bacterium]|nr:galactokinase [Planctomycetota bacterium]HRR81637.1 galactokinase [Planctomycetota bacterium]HRT96641.1 galactokinase [Planctomycetota bacterium]